MPKYHIIIEIDADSAGESTDMALRSLADIMAVQAEDGLYLAGSPDIEDFEVEGKTWTNDFVAHCSTRVGAVVEVEEDDAFDFASPGSVQGFIETGRYSTVAENREINEDRVGTVDFNVPAHTHNSGRRCVKTTRGYWFVEFEGLGPEARCHRAHK